MNVYLLILLGMSMLSSLAKATGWRPQSGDKNWHHAVDFILIAIAFVWLLSSVLES